MIPLLTRIREKVIAANPSIGKHYCGSSYCGIDPRCLEEQPRDIRFADILLAIGDASAANLGGFTRDLLNSGYDLRSDDLEKQSPECWEFIGKILGV